MDHIVVGLFNDNMHAQRAVKQLEEAGVSLKYIDIAGMPGHGGDVYDEPNISNSWGLSDNVNDNNLTRFFKSLFENDDDRPEKYSRVASGNHAVVTAFASSREMAERVADILDNCGAVEVDDQEQGTERNARSNVSDAGMGERQRENYEGSEAQKRTRCRIIQGNFEEYIRQQDQQPGTPRERYGRLTDPDNPRDM